MKVIQRIATSAALVLMCACPLAAHEHHDGHCHGLCHHWQNPAYTTEMRLQIVVMLAAVCAAAVWAWYGRRGRGPRGSEA